MNKELELRQGSGLILVAHPDDETIWMGGAILLFPKVRWTIFSLCRASDPDRAPKFKKVCRLLGAHHATIEDLEDEGIMTIAESIPEICALVKTNLIQKKFTYLFTHAYNGEYGHPRHKGVYKSAQQLLHTHTIQADTAFCFSYYLDKKTQFARPQKNASLRIMLPGRIHQQKQSLVHETYGFQKESFEYKSCAQTETFNKMIL